MTRERHPAVVIRREGFGFVIRTRKRYYLPLFGAVIDRNIDGRFYCFLQFGDRTVWIRHCY